MAILCKGCGVALKRSGLLSHLHQSKDPRCQAFLHQMCGTPIPRGATSDTGNCPSSDLIPETPNTWQPHVPLIPDETTPKTKTSIDVDTSGDFFGNYSGYSIDDMGMDIDGAEDDDEAAREVEEPEDIEDDIYEAGLAEQESGLEPKRTNQELDTNNDPAEENRDPIDSRVNTSIAITWRF